MPACVNAGDLSYWMDESFIYSLFVGERTSVRSRQALMVLFGANSRYLKACQALGWGYPPLQCARNYKCGVLYSSRWLGGVAAAQS